MSVFLAVLQLVVPPATSPFSFFLFFSLFIFVRTPFASDYPRGSCVPESLGARISVYL